MSVEIATAGSTKWRGGGSIITARTDLSIDAQVRLFVDASAGRLVIADTGVGMTRDEVHSY